MENYNLYLKTQLGRKYNLNWNIFINFLKKESDRIRNKLTCNTEKNYIFESKPKFTKFGLEKFTEINYEKYKTIANLKYKNMNLTAYKWLKYSSNSCRYDTFSFIYNFCLSNFINSNLDKLNNKIKEINDIMLKLFDKPDNQNRNILWKYCINNKIDINETSIDNKNLIVDKGYGREGYIIQLFSIFRNNEYFCIKERRKETCLLCNNIKNFNITNHDFLLIINESNIRLQNIQLILNYSLILSYETCELCNLGKNFPTCQINYEIISYPHFLIILYDFDSYLQLKLNLIDIKRLFLDTIEFSDANKYNLKGVVTCPSDNHFS